MRNQIGFVALICTVGMGTLLGCGMGEVGAPDENIESTTAAFVLGTACSAPATGVSASSVNGTNVASNAIDQNNATRWESKQGVDPQWLQLDLGSSTPLTGVTLNWETACGRDYTIQTADVSAGPWTTVFTVTNNTTAGVKTHNFTKTARFVRMNGTKRCTAYGYSLFEFQANSKIVANNYDRDGDGFGTVYYFCGVAPSGAVASNTDCNDGSASAKPGQTSYFLTQTPATNNFEAASFDWNCDGKINWMTTSGWKESDGPFMVCTDASGQRVDDCSKCIYNFTAIDSSDCGHHRCSLGAGDVDILCH